LNIGIIGFGLMGKQRARSIAQLPPHQLTAVYDPDPACARSLAAEMGYDIEPSYESLIERDDIDVVVIAVPHFRARELAVASFKAGKHVFCEKPLGLNMRDCDAILRTAERACRRLGVGFNYRFYPGIQEAKRRIEEGEIGVPTHLRCVMGHGGRPGMEHEWKTSKALCGGGALLDPGIHIIDLISFLMGQIRHGSASLFRSFWNIDVEDNAFVTLEIEGGCHAQVHLSTTEWKSRFSMDIFGTEGSISIRGRSGFYGAQTVRCNRRWAWLPERASEELVTRYPAEDTSFVAEMRAFCDAIEGHASFDLANGQDGRSALAVIERLYESASVRDAGQRLAASAAAD
jgi:predicted dehydrogenase